MSKEQYNDQQLEAVNSKDRTILCLAGAGAGKTKTLIGRIERLVKEDKVEPSSILALTFTNAAAFEMKDRYKQVPGINLSSIPEFRTFHSFCYSLIIKDKDVRTRLGYTKIPEVCDDNQMKELRTKIKLALGCSLSDEQLTKDVPLSRKDQDEKELFQKALVKEIKKENIITFDIMCYNVCELFVKNDPVIQKYKEKYTHILVDEFQDSDRGQMKFLGSFTASTNFFLAGDVLQCQPAGTVIHMSDGRFKNIEDIQIGDKVITYAPEDGVYNQGGRCGSSVTDISKRLADNIVEVKTDKHSSRYTRDHLTYCKVHYEGNEDKRCIYLMYNSEKGWWRIGQCPLFLCRGTDLGVRLRLSEEKGDKIWILDIATADSEQAWLIEQLATSKFGIPNITWQVESCSKTYYSFQSLNALYENMPDIEDRAARCLEYFGRDIRYPFLDRNQDADLRVARLDMFEIRVCNLVPEFMDLIVPQSFIESKNELRQSTLHTSYEQIIQINDCEPDWVYSLDVEQWHNYIADGILTHNCIYQFRNCSNEFIKQLTNDPNWTIIKLFENYRSTTNICEFANKFSHYSKDEYRIEMHGQRDGVDPKVIYGSCSSYAEPVDRNHLADLIDRLRENPVESAILCRSNKECAAVRSALTEAGISYVSRTKSTDAIKYLEASLSNDYLLDWLASLLDTKDYADYVRLSSFAGNPDIRWFLNLYGKKEPIQRRAKKTIEIRNIVGDKTLTAADKFEKVAKLLRVKTRCSFTGDESSTNSEIIHDIKEQLEEQAESQIYVGTIHSSKGLEYDTVYVMGVNDALFRLGTEEMNNLYYVAITRAKNNLVVYRR